MSEIHTDPEEQITVTLSATAARAVRYAAGIGLPPDRLIETAVLNWITKNNLAHVLLAAPKPLARPVGRPPKAPEASPAPATARATIAGLLRNAAARMILFEVAAPGQAPVRVRFTGWDEALDARVQLVTVVPIRDMRRWDDLVGRVVDIRLPDGPDGDGMLLTRDPAGIAADVAWLAEQELDEADRAALAKLRGQG